MSEYEITCKGNLQVLEKAYDSMMVWEFAYIGWNLIPRELITAHDSYIFFIFLLFIEKNIAVKFYFGGANNTHKILFIYIALFSPGYERLNCLG